MNDKALEGCLHGCSRRREKQVQPLQDFITLHEKILRQTRLTVEARGDLSRHTHTNGNRAETQKVLRSLSPQQKEYSPSIEKSGIALNYEPIEQLTGKTQPYQDSLKGIRYSLMQDLRIKCRS